jgi:alpha-ribazole phosphatase
MLYLLRHGEITGSSKKRYIGQLDIPLSDKGRQQAAWWQEKLSYIDFKAIYSSDLSRAVETAGIVANAQTAKIQIRPQLREIHLGDWDGMAMQVIQSRYPQAWKERGQRIDRYRTPHGESFQDLYDRVIPLFETIATNQKGNVLLVSHAGVNRMVLCHVMNKAIMELFSIPQGQAALNQIEYEQGKFNVISINRLPE